MDFILNGLGRALFAGLLASLAIWWTLATIAGLAPLPQGWSAIALASLHLLGLSAWFGMSCHMGLVSVPSTAKLTDRQRRESLRLLAWLRFVVVATVVLLLARMAADGFFGAALALNPVAILGAVILVLSIAMAAVAWLVIGVNIQMAIGVFDVATDQRPEAADRVGRFSRLNALLAVPILVVLFAGW